MVHIEHMVHCDGIWLHALKYSGKDWSFQTPFPDWASYFKAENENNSTDLKEEMKE
jgi:uncharacterized damage-inducible protein DinB